MNEKKADCKKTNLKGKAASKYCLNNQKTNADLENKKLEIQRQNKRKFIEMSDLASSFKTLY